MNDTQIILGLIKQLSEGLSYIMKETFPLCKKQPDDISNSAAKINNTAYELKRKLIMLENEIKLTSQSSSS